MNYIDSTDLIEYSQGKNYLLYHHSLSRFQYHAHPIAQI